MYGQATQRAYVSNKAAGHGGKLQVMQYKYLPLEAVEDAWALATATLTLLVRLDALAAATACALSACTYFADDVLTTKPSTVTFAMEPLTTPA